MGIIEDCYKSDPPVKQVFILFCGDKLEISFPKLDSTRQLAVLKLTKKDFKKKSLMRIWFVTISDSLNSHYKMFKKPSSQEFSLKYLDPLLSDDWQN